MKKRSAIPAFALAVLLPVTVMSCSKPSEDNTQPNSNRPDTEQSVTPEPETSAEENATEKINAPPPPIPESFSVDLLGTFSNEQKKGTDELAAYRERGGKVDQETLERKKDILQMELWNIQAQLRELNDDRYSTTIGVLRNICDSFNNDTVPWLESYGINKFKAQFLTLLGRDVMCIIWSLPEKYRDVDPGDWPFETNIDISEEIARSGGSWPAQSFSIQVKDGHIVLQKFDPNEQSVTYLENVDEEFVNFIWRNLTPEERQRLDQAQMREAEPETSEGTGPRVMYMG